VPEALGALDVVLSKADLAMIEQAVPKGAAAGGYYPAAAQVDVSR